MKREFEGDIRDLKGKEKLEAEIEMENTLHKQVHEANLKLQTTTRQT